VEAEPGVEYRIQFIGVKKGDKKSTVLEEITGTKASYPLKEVYFVRAKIISNRLQENPYIPGDFETAWTQPVWE
ncbi:MAG: histidinol-phosphatase, partial [Bacteroidetes bacterium]|nr:histidinol-phosphatase [Bacteroidota bacterium]